MRRVLGLSYTIHHHHHLSSAVTTTTRKPTMTRLRQSASLALLLSLFLTQHSASALEVSPGSDCAAYCLDDSDGNSFDADDSNTNTTDIVCHDQDYSTKSRGIKFKNCQECLQKSEHVNGTESDVHWYMCK